MHVPSHYAREYERLLTGGVWAQVEVKHEYDDETKGKRSFWITKLEPIQIATFDLDEYRAGRQSFTTDEWIDFLIRSMGYESAEMDRRLKLLLPDPAGPAGRAQLQPRRARPEGHRQELRRPRGLALFVAPDRTDNGRQPLRSHERPTEGDGADLGCRRLRRGR